MKRIILAVMVLFLLAVLACRQGQTETAATPDSPYALGRTVYGFFPSPPDVSVQSILDTYKAMGQHGDVALLQQNIPWAVFATGDDADSPNIIDIGNQYSLARQNELEVIFVVDPLNGLNRREFFGLPADWEASFANPQVRTAFTNYTLRIVREFHPTYLGLASEINTYADTNPDDFPNYLSLYNDVYDMVKAEAPETKIFVTFQWEELNNLIPVVAQGEPYDINWEQVEQFEPKLDLWAISSYPFVIFPSGKDIPADYYAPLLTRTSKPLAVAEGGYTSEPVGPFPGTPQDQVDYLSAIHNQIGGDRLAFWIYLILTDFNMESFAEVMNQQGHGGDIATLSMFASVGLREYDSSPKPALEAWDSFRNGK
ncbi:MAG: hypothetical protein A2Z15_01745 [Chloroflexi bacterium RBG_16_50_11]|nr:MAG: hypothetical protein A2Z15_01745 [Chloroflexi bacterium RBG_16_50_11]